jgi:hypothetical protein
MVDKYENPLKPKYWLPGDPNNIRQWDSLINNQGIQISR